MRPLPGEPRRGRLRPLRQHLGTCYYCGVRPPDRSHDSPVGPQVPSRRAAGPTGPLSSVPSVVGFPLASFSIFGVRAEGPFPGPEHPWGGFMKIMPLCGFALAVLASRAGIAQDEKSAPGAEKVSGSAEKATQDPTRKLSDEERAFIEKEVERRVKEALEKEKAKEKAKEPPPAPGAQDQGAKIEELDRKVNDVIEAQKKVRPSEFNPSIGLV